MTGTTRPSQRSNQKERTRAAIVAAAQELVDTDSDLTMPAVAAAAKVSEATAYRYFPDLVTLLGEVTNRMDPDAVMEPVAGSVDPVERIGHAAEVLARSALRRQTALRAIIAATIVQPRPVVRPGNRFALIERALAPWSATANPDAVRRLTRDLAVVISAEAVFTLVDLCDLSADAAVESLVRTARTLTAAATR
ncbi:TetR/AcrR family transcriptional regulator [Umezawaea tangerina]|uniref:TetR family transcriptional regulator n=1 Tax=Umezawaea tangerina TaxID=84725 RepID=A0A2T0TFM8_9PSEU|nr:TetR/AcrR family transcriptional regulator [Umezawaea tangerina]PRY44476.1 TetR family transcriptional regulator [Umezawaea tangerina]